MLTFDVRDFERAARDLKAARDQLPFAISLALNKAAAATESRLASETWATHTARATTGITGPPGIVKPARPLRRSDRTAAAVPT